MKVAGVIAEYNPFHNGHKYQLEQLKSLTGADYIITAMSGDFLQRGVPALLDKYTRANMALLGGSNLVLEIPVLWATASAEYFANAGVYLLGSTGIVDVIGYGTECPDALQPYLASFAKLLVTDDKAQKQFHTLLAKGQKNGLSYPSARMQAFRLLLPDGYPADFIDALAQPNNILALEYEKAICKWNASHTRQLSSCPITRKGDSYHQTDITCKYASATAIRALLFSYMAQSQPSEKKSGFIEQLSFAVPSTTEKILLDCQKKKLLVDVNACSQMLCYRLLSLADSPDSYMEYADCSPSLAHKIYRHQNEFVSFMQFCDLLKSRDLTYTRISRVLMHILLDIKNSDYQAYSADMDSSYLRVLGFCKSTSVLLTEIKKQGTAPLVTKVADASSFLSEHSYALFEKDIFAADCYRSLVTAHTQILQPNEFNQSLILIP